jgi:hypothetical protein
MLSFRAAGGVVRALDLAQAGGDGYEAEKSSLIALHTVGVTVAGVGVVRVGGLRVGVVRISIVRVAHGGQCVPPGGCGTPGTARTVYA